MARANRLFQVFISAVLVLACLGVAGVSAQTPPSDTSRVQVTIQGDSTAAPTVTVRAVPPPAPPANPLLLEPQSPEMTAKAPGEFKVRFETSKGMFVVEAHRDWAPRGVDRFYNLVRTGYYDQVRFFRVIGGFMAQFGIHGNPEVNRAWKEAFIADEPFKKGNTRGRVSFASRWPIPDTRSTQLFINLVDNTRLDKMFGALGEVVQGMDVVDALYPGYGECHAESRPSDIGPEQARIMDEGNDYLADGFPKLDYIVKASIVK
jgi:cyclophilin family peptidyl-prolyl cis-trans isomerase